MRISIITVVLNGEATIEETVLSVLSQQYEYVEYIVIDGGSTDKTMDIINRYRPRIHAIVSEPDQGIYDAMNKGIALATGDVIGFLNADDIYADVTVIETVAQVFKRSDVDGCFGDLLYVRRHDLRPIRYWRSGDYKPGAFANGWMPAHPTFFAKSHIYSQYGGYDVNYCLAADVELLIRLIGKCGIKTRYIPKLFVKMRLGGISNKQMMVIIKQNIAIYRALKANGMRFSWLFPIKKFLKRLQQFWEGITYNHI